MRWLAVRRVKARERQRIAAGRLEIHPGTVSNDIAALPLFPQRGAALRLRDVADVREGAAAQSIQRENQNRFITVVLLAIFLVFAVMAVQYESLVNPLVIMGAIPLALIGVVLALSLTGLPISAPVMLGVILLTGVVVNNGILSASSVQRKCKFFEPTLSPHGG